MKLLNSLQEFFRKKPSVAEASAIWAEQNYPQERRQTAARVAAVLVNQLNVGFKQLAPDTRLNQDLGVDGYDLDDVELLMAIEDEFQISIPDDDEAGYIVTVGELIEYVTKRTAER